LELERNITILTGESGIGKTALARLVQNYEDAGKQSGVAVQCKVPCRSITSDDGWQNRLNSIHNSIIFIDEGRRFLKRRDFAEAIEGCDNYFVLITRESLPQISYSVHSVLTLKNTVKRGSKHYSKAYERFDFVSHFSDVLHDAKFLITEDSNAGFEAFRKLSEGTTCACVAAGGKSRIAPLLISYGSQSVIVVADGAAFGSEMNNVYNYYQENQTNVTLYLPECFEWLILKSSIVSGPRIRVILNRPWNYILSEEYKSWELFFTDLLIRYTAGTKLQYSKRNLAKAYLTSGNIRKIREAIEQQEAAAKK
jgi:hypothetical protein